MLWITTSYIYEHDALSGIFDFICRLNTQYVDTDCTSSSISPGLKFRLSFPSYAYFDRTSCIAQIWDLSNDSPVSVSAYFVATNLLKGRSIVCQLLLPKGPPPRFKESRTSYSIVQATPLKSEESRMTHLYRLPSPFTRSLNPVALERSRALSRGNVRTPVNPPLFASSTNPEKRAYSSPTTNVLRLTPPTVDMVESIWTICGKIRRLIL